MLKPERLKKDDTIAVISPSWGGPGLYPYIFDKGLENLKEMGFRIKEYPTARMSADELHRNPELRAQDINKAFADREVKGIITSIGGDDSARVLRYLDTDIILNNPKLFMGYSDTTGYTSYLNQKGLVIFNGPAVMAGFSQLGSFPPEYRRYLEKFLFDEWSTLELPHFPSYSDGYLPWCEENAGKIIPPVTDEGMRWLQGEKKSSGTLWGGCIEVLEMLKGTEFWPEPSFWEGKILFFETSEDNPSVDYVRYWLRNYGVMGVYDKIEGLLFGRARDFSDKKKKELDETIISVVKGEFGREDLNIISNMSFGHTDPQIILPLGTVLQIDPAAEKLLLSESPFN
ncbi:S66 family peptidase [Spirochaeta isovalerica]|uniref:Muramoyltetrapeptide carboxypeptidase LdcA involved in peptidoglycan recycling n=1 Tax=Spirochaeta isovalerica TaxID=150 RepID=A0A841R7D9_9SPIO|nr:S66 peptidase family protein [Spirochaeta isovalerica]MBB6479763.1 muramoyltetrapeptide carboxypeptidase LdcA involved in peptidoglycan recycling [Spirochaeta isovalerica]